MPGVANEKDFFPAISNKATDDDMFGMIHRLLTVFGFFGNPVHLLMKTTLQLVPAFFSTSALLERVDQKAVAVVILAPESINTH